MKLSEYKWKFHGLYDKTDHTLFFKDKKRKTTLNDLYELSLDEEYANSNIDLDDLSLPLEMIEYYCFREYLTSISNTKGVGQAIEQMFYFFSWYKAGFLDDENDTLIKESLYWLAELRYQLEEDQANYGFELWVELSTAINKLYEIEFTKAKLFGDEIIPIISASNLSKIDAVKQGLERFKFNDLPIIKSLSEKSVNDIIHKIVEAGIPYAIALFDYVGFIDHLKKNFFTNNGEMNKELAKLFRTKNDRGIKGNINSLSKSSNEDKNRYTSYKYKDDVKKYVDNLN